MSCPCDTAVFPPRLSIPAGLDRVPRQLATFPEYRAAMLRAINSKSPLLGWRARSRDDFGVMLLEFWAYLCDNLSFIDEFLANEVLLRCALDRASLRKLTSLLGYVPRPALAAQVDLALLLSGRRPVLIPAGTAFRSGAFPGSPPQVFETANDVTLDPRANEWTVRRKRATTIGGSGSITSLLIDPATLRVKEGEVVRITGPGISFGRKITRVSDTTGPDGERYRTIEWTGAAAVSASTAPSSLKVWRPSRSAKLWTKPVASTDSHVPLYLSANLEYIVFDSVYRDLRTGSAFALEREGEVRVYTAANRNEFGFQMAPGATTEILDGSNKVTAKVTSPALKQDLTWVHPSPFINNASVKSANAPNWTENDAGTIHMFFGFEPAGDVVGPYQPQISPGEPILLERPVEAPLASLPVLFQFGDADANGDAVSGTLNVAQRRIFPDQGSGLRAPMTHPVTAWGNIVHGTRGETVAWEVLGTGDATQTRQSFTLKKKPLTYLPGPVAPVSSLHLYVDGVLWSEAPSFYGREPGEQVYIVRENDEQATVVTLNSRLKTGAIIAATYRCGGGLLSPPAGSLKQIARPVEGLRGVRNPMAAFGGDDREAEEGLRICAPRSAMLLGRAISLPDMEAAAITVGGVRAARAGWRWNTAGQSPVAQLWYIGAAGAGALLLDRLRGLTDGVTPIRVDQAQPAPVALSLSLTIDPTRIEADVLAAVNDALLAPGEGFVVPERVGIGVPLFRSRLFETVLEVPGVRSVNGLLWNNVNWSAFAKDPGAGKYFDFENGAVFLNGKEQ